MRFGELLNDAHVRPMPPMSVGGGDCADGNCAPIAVFCGPGSVTPLALMAPCGGWSGLPNEAECAAVVTAPAAETASTSRLENMVVTLKLMVEFAAWQAGASLRSLRYASLDKT